MYAVNTPDGTFECITLAGAEAIVSIYHLDWCSVRILVDKLVGHTEMMPQGAGPL